jgi:hypothetical protein
MIDKNSKNIGFPSQLGILLGLFGGGIILGTLISVAIWLAMTGRSFQTIQSDLLNPQYYYAAMTVQGISTFFMFFLPVYFLARICYKNPYQYIGFNKIFNYQQILLVIGILFLTLLFSDTLNQLTKLIPLPKNLEVTFQKYESSRDAQQSALVQINTFSKYIFSLIIVGVFPAIFEEVLFRGGLQNILTRWSKSPWAAIIITSIIFSAIHLSFYGFFVRFGLGVILGFLFYYSGNIWLPILLHFLFNGLQVTALYISSISQSKTKDITEQHLPIWIGLIALVATILLFIRFKKVSKKLKDIFVYEEVKDPNDFHDWIAKNS